MTKFEVGKKYYCYSPYNSDRLYEFEVVKRTEKMVTVKNSDVEIKRRKIDTRVIEEIIYPNGKYSMCLVLGSNHVVTETEEKAENVTEEKENNITYVDFEKKEEKSKKMQHTVQSMKIQQQEQKV